MTAIRPISDLRNKTQEISDLVHSSDEPVFITKNGAGDLVVMSLAAYERDQGRLELYRLLEESEADLARVDRGVTLKTLRKRLKR
jgi:prevent-host-death family protein